MSDSMSILRWAWSSFDVGTEKNSQVVADGLVGDDS